MYSLSYPKVHSIQVHSKPSKYSKLRKEGSAAAAEASKSGRASFSLLLGSVRWVAEGLKQSEALLLIGGSQSLGAENTAGEAFGAPECAGLAR